MKSGGAGIARRAIMADKEKDKAHDPKKEKGEKHAKPAGDKAPAPAGAAAPKAEKKEKKGPRIEGGEQLPPKTLRLREKYNAEVVPALQQKFQLKNKNAVPRIVKVCLNMGFGKAATDNNPKVGEQCLVDMTQIAGQK